MPRPPRNLVPFVLSFAFSSLLTGCALQTTAAPSADLVPGTAISGTVHGGQQLVSSAKVYLLAVNPTGYGGPGIAASSANASVSLLKANKTNHAADTIGSYVLTTAGGFSLLGDYSCTSGFAQGTGATVNLSGSEQVYLYVLGGQAANITSANTSSGLLVALGPCGNPTTQVDVNEMTTAATAYAFAGFATDATHIGSSGSTLAVTGLTNAFANVGTLANVATGAALNGNVVGDNIVRPTANINTIADVLASCVDGLTGNGNCNTLFQYTASAGATGTAPTDTATAAINLAHNPWPTAAGLTALYGLVPATGAPFQPALSAQPTDFTLTLQTIVGGLNTPVGIAIDAAGNAWVQNTGSYSISKFGSNFAAITGSSSTYHGGGLNDANFLAIDASGNVWAANINGNSLSEFSSAGVAQSPAPGGFTGGGLSYPYGIAIEATGNVWAADYGNYSLSEFYSNGTAKSSTSGFHGNGLNNPVIVAFDTSDNLWIGNSGANSLGEFSSNGISECPSPAGFTGGGLDQGGGIAIDASGNIWSANTGNNSLSKFSNAGVPQSSSTGYTGGGLNGPTLVAIDSQGYVWATNNTGKSLSVFSNAGVAKSGPGGYASGGYNGPYGIAIDGSGNVWVTNLTGSSLIEVIGAASPVVTPIVGNLLAPYGTSTVSLP